MSADNPNSPYYRPPEYMAEVEEDAGDYIGEVDDQGMRFGTGTCTWADGSKYHGDWNQNVRHGNGTYETPSDGTKYEGQWVNDHKHGNGQQHQANGTVIQATWQTDRLNGLAYITKAGEKEPTTIIFKDDMKIQANNSGLTQCDRFYVIVSIFFFILFIAGVGTGTAGHVIGRGGEGLTMGYVLCSTWAILWVVSFCQTATRYICNLVLLDTVFKNIDECIKRPPEVNFYLTAYHMETKTITSTDGNGNTTHREVKEKVVTHRAEKQFKIKKWEDRSPPSKTLHFLSVLLLTRLHTNKQIHFSSKAHRRFKKKERKFIRKNDTDEHYDYHCTKEIIGHQAECLVYSPEKGVKPWYVNICTMIVLDLVMFGWIQRYYLNKNTKVVEYEIIKLIKT